MLFLGEEISTASLATTGAASPILCAGSTSSAVPLVVFEATGAYHRTLEASLGATGFLFCKVNPRQSRRFAEATGRLAKTDRVDAATLARMGAVLDLPAEEESMSEKSRALETAPATQGQMAESDRGAPVFRPLADIVETGNGVSVQIEMPGVSPDDVDISVEGRMLAVRGRSRACLRRITAIA